MGRRDALFLGVILAGSAAIGPSLAPPRSSPGDARPSARVDPGVRDAAARVDAALRDPSAPRVAGRAPDLAVIRRLSLAMAGTIPSLEEIRRIEAGPAEARVERHLDALLGDRRSADYLAERLARAFVGVEGGPFLVYRRRRFVAWLSDQLMANRPYDALVRDLISGLGLWTDHPATNFVTVAYDPIKEEPNAERLAARVARAFLGARIDCAQCHDHPFQPWKQADFRGLAAYFGQARSGLTGIRDDPTLAFTVEDRRSGKLVAVEPRAPFLPGLDPKVGTRRERLARWVTDRGNPSFARSAANRAWALLFGRPLVEPVDDLLAAGTEVPEALRLLADDFAANGHDLRRLIRTIAATDAFRVDSATPDDRPALQAPWSTFPLTRLRPEQVAGALQQAASTRTIDAQSHILVRLATYGGVNDFVRRHGDPGEAEFDDEAASTIPQRLLMMNGDLVDKSIKADLGNATARIALLAPDDARAVEAAYLAILTRRPTPEEARHFEGRMAGTRGEDRKARITDLAWTLLNATEFSWNH